MTKCLRRDKNYLNYKFIVSHSMISTMVYFHAQRWSKIFNNATFRMNLPKSHAHSSSQREMEGRMRKIMPNTQKRIPIILRWNYNALYNNDQLSGHLLLSLSIDWYASFSLICLIITWGINIIIFYKIEYHGE